MAKITFTPEQMQTIVTRYTSGEPAEAIGKDFNCNKTTILRKIRKTGTPTRSSTKIWFSEAQREEITARYTAGEWAEDIAPSMHCGGATILRALDAWGVPHRNRIALRTKGNAIEFTAAQKEAILLRYTEKKEHLKDIAADMRCSPGTIKKFLKTQEVAIRLLLPKTAFTENERNEMLAMYTAKKSLTEIAGHFECSGTLIASTLRSLGCMIRRKGKPQKYFTVNGVKTCRVCKEPKPCTDFTLSSCTSDGLQPSCRACNRKHAKIWNLQKKFGITPAQYESMVLAQGSVCAICQGPETRIKFGELTALAVDHDHKTGKVRGLLCHACNVSIGHFQDDPERLEAAAAYIRRHRAQGASAT